MSFKDYLKEWGGNRKSFDNKTIGEISSITEKAKDAFWAVIAQGFPNIKTGDVSPLQDQAFHRECLDAVTDWVEGNQVAK